jgi:hypothetical protein
MSSIAVSSIVFACAFGGAILGMSIRAKLPQPHLNPESKDIVKLGMGLVGTLSALVLGLLIASAKGSYDAQSSELTQMAARVVVLDRVLAHYGPETKELALSCVAPSFAFSIRRGLKGMQALPSWKHRPAAKASSTKYRNSRPRMTSNACCKLRQRASC